MPYLTAAHACGQAKIVRGGSDTHVHARPYGQTACDFRHGVQCNTKKSQKAEDDGALISVMRRADCSLKQQIDISDSASISEVSVFTLLNAQ